jgi:hypothetical protein
MAKKARKRLGQDLKVKDVLLLDRPEVEIIKDVTAEQKLRRAPKGRYLLVQDKKSKEEYVIYVGENEKMDCTHRPSWWEKFKTYLDDNHKRHTEKKQSLIPPLFK